MILALLLAIVLGTNGGAPPGPGPVPYLTIGRLHYDGGGDWYADPSALPNLLAAIRTRTGLLVEPRERTVRLSDPQLWSIPYLYATGHGDIHWSDQDLVTLRLYLERGGFLHINDSYGMDPSVRREVGRLFPDIPFVDVPLDHPIYHLIYDLPRGIPKIHQHDGLPPRGLGIFLHGRLVLYYSYESDIGDGWEDPDVHHDPPAKREEALEMGVNLFAYAVGYAG